MNGGTRKEVIKLGFRVSHFRTVGSFEINDPTPPNSVPGELRLILEVRQTDIMTKKINKPELAILNDIFVTVAS